MRSPATVLILISFFFAKFARSQSNELIIQGQTGKLYLEHTVVAKENWYSIGRLYNSNPKELAPFNHLTMTQPLTIGQTLQIPLTAVNFSQNGLKVAGETLVPVIHITQEKEWMYRISVNNNKVPIPNIEKWNNVTPDQIHPGMHLIVGYLKVKTALSALATNTSTAPTPPSPTPPAPAPAVATTTKPASAAPAPTNPVPAPTVATTKPVATPPTPKPATTPSTSKPPVNTDSPAAPAPVTSTTIASTPTPKTPPTSTPVAPAPTPAAPPVSTPPTPHFNGGTFRSEYSDGSKSASGQAGVFKSTSGWQDGKYYALMNNMTVGTIVKITDPTTSKTVYVKILGQLPDMKESSGLAIRMSNAAAAELGEGDTRFSVQINY